MGRTLTGCLRATVLALLHLGAADAAAETRVVQELVAPNPAFPDAVAPGTLTWVCSEDLDRLRAHFAARRAPFDDELVRRRNGRRCHIDYEPSLPGFRADADDLPIEELIVNVDTLNFLAHRAEPFGDTVDIGKAVISQLPRPIRITISAEREIDPKWYDAAARFHFGDAAGQVRWRRDSVPGQTHPWTQDFLKSGRVRGANRVLMTRHLYEGRQQDGAIYAPMLDALESHRFVRSNLSWEGGDLQFVRDPKDPSRLVLAYGDAARGYWGADLDDAEYAYVLKREFGADAVIDLTELVPHVDYFVSFLPGARTALVSQPLTGSREAALAAAQALIGRFDGAAPPTLLELAAALSRPDALTDRRRTVERLLAQARAEAGKGWPQTFDPALGERMARHVAANCPTLPQACFSNLAVVKLLESDPRFLNDWVTAALKGRTEALMDARLLSVVEGQLLERAETQPRVDAKVRELEALGFRVVRVPRLGGDPGLSTPWTGISYVNALLVDRVLFVPEFGLGEFERRVFEELGRALPAGYRVVPVYARHMFLKNGGVHCTVAIVRGAT